MPLVRYYNEVGKLGLFSSSIIVIVFFFLIVLMKGIITLIDRKSELESDLVLVIV